MREVDQGQWPPASCQDCHYFGASSIVREQLLDLRSSQLTNIRRFLEAAKLRWRRLAHGMGRWKCGVKLKMSARGDHHVRGRDVDRGKHRGKGGCPTLLRVFVQSVENQ